MEDFLRMRQIKTFKSSHHAEFNPATKHEAKKQATVSRYVALGLYCCSIMGFAPLAFKKQGSFWVVRVSRIAYVYSLLLISTLIVIVISAGAVLDLAHGEDNRRQTQTEIIMRGLNVALVMILVFISTCIAPNTLEGTFSFVARLKKVNLQINSKSTWIERRYLIILVTYLILTIIIYFYEGYNLVTHILFQTTDRRLTSCLHISLYWLYFGLIYIILLFNFNVMAMYSSLKTINDHVERLCHIVKTEGIQNIKGNALIERHEIPVDTTVPIKSVNIVIDRITFNTDLLLPKKKSVQDTIRVLGVSYLKVCELIRQVNKQFGYVMVLLLLCSVISMIIRTYNLLSAILQKSGIVLHLIWLFEHITSILLLSEPCHWTDQELARTRRLMVQLTCRTATVVGPFTVELRKFFSCLCLDKTSYSPLGICTLTRPVWTSVMGSVATYLVVVMQFDVIKA